RAGDCDDTSVLMAALLGNVGVPTRLVDVPGHLFLMADTGVHAGKRMGLSVDEGLTQVVDDEGWIPIETTAMSQGFIDAWRIGAERYASWKAEGRLVTWDVAESQARYEPSDAPGRHTLPAFDDSVVSRHVAADASRLEGLRREFMATHFDEARRRLEITP